MTVATGDEVQTITINATSGTFTLTYAGQTTSALAFDAAAATVQTALRALSTIGSGNCTVTGSAGGPYTVTFTGTLADTDTSAITSDATSLAGGTHTATVVQTTAGNPSATEIVYVDDSVASGRISNKEVRIGQVPPSGHARVSSNDYYRS